MLLLEEEALTAAHSLPMFDSCPESSCQSVGFIMTQRMVGNAVSCSAAVSHGDFCCSRLLRRERVRALSCAAAVPAETRRRSVDRLAGMALLLLLSTCCGMHFVQQSQ